MAEITEIRFTKGHGTRNDFVLVPDLDGALEIDEELVRELADRHTGVGGDGVIRVVPTEAATEDAVRVHQGRARWFMDYRNADGSLAQMCGNGTRVFAAYLRREGLETGTEFAIATRSGVKRIRFEDSLIATDMGTWSRVDADRFDHDEWDAEVELSTVGPIAAMSIDMGNPHTVAVLPNSVELAKLDLSRRPQVRPEPPHGTNIELVHKVGPSHLQMRVYERGVGETQSCGTGVCAAVLAVSLSEDGTEPQGDWWVDVPGGRLRVRSLPGHAIELAGPAELVADGTFLAVNRSN